MKFLYALALLPLLAAAAPLPKPSGYVYPLAKRAEPAFAKRQVTVADLKRRAEYGDKEHDKDKDHHHKPSAVYARATAGIL